MFKRNFKKFVPVLAMALAPLASNGAGAASSGVLFSAAQPAGGVAPNFVVPGTGMVGMNAGGAPISQFATGLRTAGVTDWLKQYMTATISAPDAAGNVTKTQTCATEFRNPATSALRYRMLVHMLTSLPYAAPMGHVMTSCSASPMNQAGNALGLLAEAITVSQMVITPTGTSFPTRVRVRVSNPVSGAALWAAILAPTVAMGDPQYGVVVDTDGNGTDEVVFLYNKNVTPVGYSGTQMQYTRVVRNGLTGAVTNTFTWTEVNPM